MTSSSPQPEIETPVDMMLLEAVKAGSPSSSGDAVAQYSSEPDRGSTRRSVNWESPISHGRFTVVPLKRPRRLREMSPDDSQNVWEEMNREEFVSVLDSRLGPLHQRLDASDQISKALQGTIERFDRTVDDLRADMRETRTETNETIRELQRSIVDLTKSVAHLDGQMTRIDDRITAGIWKWSIAVGAAAAAIGSFFAIVLK